MRKHDLSPLGIVEARGRNSGACLAAKQPFLVQVVPTAVWVGFRRGRLRLCRQRARCGRTEDEHPPVHLLFVVLGRHRTLA